MTAQGSKSVGAASGLDAFIGIEQGALDAIPTGFCVCRADSGLVRYNRRAVELWGRALPLGDPSEQHGSAFRRYNPDGEPLRFDSTPVARAMRSGETVIGAELVIERPDGSRVPVLMNVMPLKDASGRVEGAVCSFQELTERKRAEDALRASEAELQSVINRTPFMLVRCSRDLRYLFISEAYAQLIGCSRDAVIGKTIMDVLGEKGFNTLRPYADRVLRGEAVEFECELDFAQIGARLLHIAYRPEMDGAGHVDGWIASILDITAQKSLESELRSLSEKLEAEVERRTLERDRIWNVSEDLLAVSNFDGYFLSLNPAWTRLLGWTEDEIKSMHVNDLRHPDDAENAIAGRAQLARGVSTVRMENRFRHKDGSWRWLQWTMTEDNGLIYVAGRHVTAEKEAAAALERAQHQAAHLQKMEAIGQLTGGIAHDFNNLLMIVSGHAQSLKKRLTDARDARALAAIEMAATRGENLTRQLLSFSRTLPLSPTVIDPVEAVHAIRDVLSGSMHVNIEFQIEVPNTTWPVRVDKSELELALVNLAVNARDAMPDGGRILIAAENVQLNGKELPDGISGDFVALSVTDTGGGIPADLLPRVVEPFFTTKGPDKGTGLGLSQVYGFARRSEGTIAIDSDIGRGTKITVYLPRSHAAVAAPLPQDTANYVSVERQTILVVEDNPEVRHVAVSLLEQLGYDTLEAETASAALAVLGSGADIKAVFSDVVLPGQTDGLALARIVRERHPHIPVVLTTGYTRLFDKDQEFPVLRKPYQISALGRIIHDALDPSMPTRSAQAS
ncbi:MAG: PAS domain S-box protein [Xanthobacteraceae bacterium]|jgi:PAS domain S-box-containing protein